MSDKPKFGSGALSAALRQGFGEIGAALKAFPDAVQVDVLGTLGNPAASEVLPGKDHSRPQSAEKGREIEME